MLLPFRQLSDLFNNLGIADTQSVLKCLQPCQTIVLVSCIYYLQKKAELEKVDHPPSIFGKFIPRFFNHANEAKNPPKDDTGKVEEETLGSKVDDALGLIRGILEKWPIPRVRDGRAFQWRSDEEFARAVSVYLASLLQVPKSLCSTCPYMKNKENACKSGLKLASSLESVSMLSLHATHT